MTDIPSQNPLTLEQAWEKLNYWHDQALTARAAAQASEVLLRKELARFYFPAPIEGSNRLNIGWGKDLKLDFSLTRSVDEAVLDASTKELRKAKVKVDELFEYKPSLVLSAYRELSTEQRKLVDTMLTIKPSETPKLSIVDSAAAEEGAPKRKRIKGPLVTQTAPNVPMTDQANGASPWEEQGVQVATGSGKRKKAAAAPVAEPPAPKRRGRPPGSGKAK